MPTSKSLILTGASRGIGLAIAKYLLKDSHKLFLVSRTAGPLEELKSEYPGQVEFVAADLADFSVGPKVVELALTAFSRIDGVIINHGTLSPVKRIADSTPEEWRSLFDVNFFSAIAFVSVVYPTAYDILKDYEIKSAIPQLRKSHGKIVITSSGAATGAYSTWGPYGASKAALNHLAMTLSVEEPDITTVSIRPGVVDTQMQSEVRGYNKVMDPQDAEKFKSLHEGGKLLRPEQPGNVIARLALGAEKGLSGRFLSWDDKQLEKYQDL